MYVITKKLKFHAGHRLINLPPGHKCSRLHGHTYSVEVELGAEGLDGAGMVMDYSDVVTELLKPFIEKFDHRFFVHKDDQLAAALQRAGEGESLTILPNNPTAEVIAKLLYDGISFSLNQMQSPGEFNPHAPIKLLSITVQESESSSATVRK